MRSNRRRHRLAAILLLAPVALSVGPAAAGAQERNIEPVTDAMLQDPDPADWLNWRRTLDGWGYSPLDQIDRDNVHELQLVWGWPLATRLRPADAARAGRRDVHPEPGQTACRRSTPRPASASGSTSRRRPR